MAVAYTAYEIAPDQAAPLVIELRGLLTSLEGAVHRMTKQDRRYYLSMMQYSERVDIAERIHEIKLIWMRRMAAEYLEKEAEN